jgi:hypothetical protein
VVEEVALRPSRWLRRSLCDRLETTVPVMEARTGSTWCRDRRHGAILDQRNEVVSEGQEDPGFPAYPRLS